jgi:hypothetical protein
MNLDWCPKCNVQATWAGAAYDCDTYLCHSCSDNWAACSGCEVVLGQGCATRAVRAAKGHRRTVHAPVSVATAPADCCGGSPSGHGSDSDSAGGSTGAAAAAVPAVLAEHDIEHIELSRSCTTADLEHLGLPTGTSANDGEHGCVQWPEECSFFDDCSSGGAQHAKRKLVLCALTAGEPTDELLELMPSAFCEAALLQARLVRDLTARQREMLGAVMAAAGVAAEERGAATAAAAAAVAQRDAVAAERERVVGKLLPFLSMDLGDAMVQAGVPAPACAPDCAPPFPYKLPTAPTDMRRQLVDGAHAIIKGVPRPQPQMVGDHSYVSLTSVIAHVLAHGPVGLDVLVGEAPAAVRKRSESRQARRVWKLVMDNAGGMEPLVLWLIEWVRVCLFVCLFVCFFSFFLPATPTRRGC